jgi:hypothetical protein
MPSAVYGQIKSAFKHLSPSEVRELAERPLSVGLIASTSAGFAAMEELLAPPALSPARRCEIERVLHRASLADGPRPFDLTLCESELLCPRGGFRFDPAKPRDTIREIVDRREDLRLALARNFLPFRRPVIAKIIKTIARENAMFSVVTALPDVLPTLIELPWAVGEFASDTAFLTMNQVRMAFLIAEASDQEAGYSEQRAQIAGIVAGAFGWRALARELAGKIPFGGGLIPKAAIAFAGTFTVGIGLERFYRLGYGLTREERRRVYQRALERGRSLVASVVEAARMRSRANPGQYTHSPISGIGE